MRVKYRFKFCRPSNVLVNAKNREREYVPLEACIRLCFSSVASSARALASSIESLRLKIAEH